MFPGMNGERKAKIKHGHYSGNRPSPEYYSWRSIKARCFNQKHQSFPKYGGSGITMDPTWADSFQAFLEAVGPRPTLVHTLDRIRPEDGYVPGNVRWATRTTQNRNRSDNHWITANGQTLCLEDWARQLGCSPNAIRTRVKRGWTWERAVTTPPNKKLQSNNKTVAQPVSIARAFGTGEITMVISPVGKASLFYERTQIGVLSHFHVSCTADGIPRVEVSFPQIDQSSPVHKMIERHIATLSQSPWVSVSFT